jgi:high-affinity nickel-transport protein
MDTIDGALMYTSTPLARDIIAVLYYSIVLIAIVVLVASVANPGGKLWDGVNIVGGNFDIIGGSICDLLRCVILHRLYCMDHGGGGSLNPN